MENNTQVANPLQEADQSVDVIDSAEPAESQGEQIDSPTAEQPQEAQGDEGNEESQPEAELIEVEFVDDTGEKVKKGVTVDELKKGFMLERDYRHKTASLSKQANEFQMAQHQWAQSFYQKASSQLAEIETAHQAALEGEFHGVNWEQLAQHDPDYGVKKERFLAMQERVKQVSQYRSQLEQQAKAESMQRFVSMAPQLVPGWTPHPANAKNIELTNTALSLGFSPQEISQIDDPRLLKVLDVVAQGLSKGAQTKAIAEKKVAQASPVLKPQSTKAQAAGRSASQSQAVAKAMKSGRWQDLAGALPTL